MALTHASVSADTNRDGIIARSNEQEVAVDEGMHAIVPLVLVTLAVAMLSGVRVVAGRRRHDWDAEGMMYVGLPTYAAAIGAAMVAMIVLFGAWAAPQRSVALQTYWLLAAARDAIGALALSILAFHEVKTDPPSSDWGA